MGRPEDAGCGSDPGARVLAPVMAADASVTSLLTFGGHCSHDANRLSGNELRLSSVCVLFVGENKHRANATPKLVTLTQDRPEGWATHVVTRGASTEGSIQYRPILSLSNYKYQSKFVILRL